MNIFLYKQTGFNSVDIPDSIKTLEDNFEVFKSYNDVELVQRDYLAFITIDGISREEAPKIDYVIVEDDSIVSRTAYTVAEYEFKGDDVVSLKLIMDAYNTLGGFGADSGNYIVSGSANRLSVSIEEDNANYFTLEEPFSNGERVDLSFQDLGLSAQPNGNYSLIETITVPPAIVEPVIEEGSKTIEGIEVQTASNARRSYEGAKIGDYRVVEKQTTSSGDVKGLTLGSLISPNLRKLITTLITIVGFGKTSTISTNTRWWQDSKINYNKMVKGEEVVGSLINDFRNNGRDNDIINYWEVPKMFIESISDSQYDPTMKEDYGGISTIIGKQVSSTVSITPKLVYNNKARYSQSIQVKIFNVCSGAQINKNVYEIVNAGTLPGAQLFNADYYISADIRPQGSPIFSFKNNNGTDQTQYLPEIIKGGQWRSIPLGIQGLSNANFINEQLKNQFEKNITQNNLKFFGGIAEILAGIGIGAVSAGATATGAGAPAGVAGFGTSGAMISRGVSNMVGTMTGFVNQSVEQKFQRDLLNQESKSASAQLSIGSSDFCREMGKNWFFACISSYSANDMQAYDAFLTKYGYNVGSRKLTNLDFYSRPAFNFVKINSITIESARGSIYLINKVQEQLKAGVRIWHKKPNTADMSAGGNRNDN